MDKHILLHPPMNVKNFKGKDEALFINRTKNGKFEVFFLDAHFEYLPEFMNVHVKDFSKFLDSAYCQNLKAVIFLLADMDDASSLVNLDIRQMVYEEIRKRKWHICFIHPIRVSIMSMLLASKIDSKPGDIIMSVSSTGQMITVSELQRKQEGYSYIGNRNINSFNRNATDVAAECLGACEPKYVIDCGQQCNDLINSLKSRIAPSKNVIYTDLDANSENFLLVLKTIFEHGYNQVIPYTMDILAVTNESNITDPELAAIAVDDDYEDLPLEKIKIVHKSNKQYYVVYLDKTSGTYKPAGKAQESKEQDGHRIKLALVVDRNTLPFLYQEPFIIPEIEALPQKLATQPDLNVPVIGFFDNSSVICVRDEKGYKFLNEWNGLYGNDLYLSFEQEEPIVITDFRKVKNKDPFVVYDLVKVLSMKPNDLKIDPKWGFKVTSDEPVLLEVETFLGNRKAATPFFLMALLLKHHIKAIKKETGMKPKELGFCLFNEFNNEEKNRIHTGLKEACELLKIGFVIITDV